MMLSCNDSTEHIEQPRSTRMDQRTKPLVKETIQRAAALLGMNDSAFVTRSAYERAIATIEDHERTFVAGEDAVVFIAAIASPAEPTAALGEAVTTHSRLIRTGE